MNELLDKYGVPGFAEGGSAAYEWWKAQGKTPDEYYGYLTQKLGEMPNMSRAQIDAAMQQYGISNEDVATAMQRAGMSQAAQWNVLSGSQGLAGLNENIRAAAERALEDPGYARSTAEKQMKLYGINEADVQRATGMGLGEIFDRPTPPPAPPPAPPALPVTPVLPVTPAPPPAPEPVIPPAAQPGTIYNVTPAPLVEPKLPFTGPEGTLYPNAIQTPQGSQPTYFPTSWWTSSPSASTAYSQTAPSTARDFSAQLAAYKQQYAPRYYLPAPPPVVAGGGVGTAAAQSGADSPPGPPAQGFVWQRNPVTQAWEQVPDPGVQAATGGAVSELWDKYHG